MGKKRSKTTQSKHDRKVRSIANGYKRKRWKVTADIMGFPKPKSIGKSKRIPDVVATRPGTRHIIEVETPKTQKAHKNQLSTFRRSASQKTRTKFIEKITR